MNNLFINNKPYKLHKVKELVLQGGKWRSGVKIDQYDIKNNKIDYDIIEIIECHINEGKMLYGSIKDYNVFWYTLPFGISHLYMKVFKYMPQNNGAKEYYFNLLHCLDGDDINDIKNRSHAVKMILNVLDS